MKYFLSAMVWGSMYTPSTFHNTTPSKANTVSAMTTATLTNVTLINRSTWSLPWSGASRAPTRACTIVDRASLPDPFSFPLPYPEKYGASHSLERVRAVIFSDVIGEDGTEIAATFDLVHEDRPQRRPLA